MAKETNAKKIKKTFSLKEVVFLILTTCVVSLTMGYALANRKDVKEKYDKYVQLFVDNYNYILNHYYNDLDKEALINGAIDGMVDSLKDEYSEYIDNSNYFDTVLNGSYQGIGIQVVTTTDNRNIIYSVIEDSPAAVSGIQKYDEIISIDGKTFQDSTSLAKYVRDSKSGMFKMKVLRKDEQLEIDLNRSLVVIKSIESKLIEEDNKKIGYIKVGVFATNTAEQFQDAILDLEEKNIDSLIIDVRDNTGGHLTTVVRMLSSLLDSSKVIYQMDIKGKITKYYSQGKQTKEYPIVILQNSSSASASELFSATMKEQYGATIVGSTSYGKGTVQELVKLSNGKEYKLTTKKWLTSDGIWINEKGVKPDIEVINDEQSNTDEQLEKAIEILKQD